MLKQTTKPAKVEISSKVRNYGKDPVFIKKAKESKAFLEKNGFPEELLIKRNKQ